MLHKHNEVWFKITQNAGFFLKMDCLNISKSFNHHRLQIPDCWVKGMREIPKAPLYPQHSFYSSISARHYSDSSHLQICTMLATHTKYHECKEIGWNVSPLLPKLSSISQFPSVSETKPSIASVKEIKCKQRKKPRKKWEWNWLCI